MSQQQISDTKQYIFSGILIAISILGSDYLGFYFLFKDYVDMSPLLIFLTGALTLGSSLSILRFLSQITNEDVETIYSKWRVVGQVSAGISLAGIPYIVLISFINFEGSTSLSNQNLTFLLTFIFVTISNLMLMLVPDLFGESLLSKQSESSLSLFNHNPDSVFWVSLDGEIVNVNKEAEKLTGFSKEELIGIHFNDLLIEKLTTNW